MKRFEVTELFHRNDDLTPKEWIKFDKNNLQTFPNWKTGD